ncbi:MAG: RNA-binding transcriptional accessory protein, partial [Rhodocyclaceae bacterium]|nr:RNA-binding transcriptional accessory protein [Rhodocyclaceae bacterium]
MLPAIEQRIAEELGARTQQVAAAIALLDEGATVPFIARYRKEATGGLDDTQLRTLAERLVYLRELEERRAAVLASVAEQGKLTPGLQHDIEHADTKQRLEDLYLPYKPKRRTKAQIALEAGLGPLAEALLADPLLTPEEEALKYVDAGKEVADAKAALEGARHILMERFAEDAGLLAALREHVAAHGVLVSAVIDGKQEEGAKFRDWFDFREPVGAIPSHRALALFRGRNEGFLRLSLKLDEELAENRAPGPNACERMIAARFGLRDEGRPGDKWLQETVRWTWMVKLSLHFELEFMGALRERAEEEAIRVFARNLHDLLLAAPAGPRTVIGLDPGLRTGVKVAAVDRTGKLLDTATIYPHAPRNDWDGALHILEQLA